MQPAPAPVRPAATAPGTLRPGDTGARVRALQLRLRALHYDPGAADGRFRSDTRTAVWAFQKVQRMRPDGVVDGPVWKALAHPRTPRALTRAHESARVDIDLKRQLLVAYRKGRPVLISHISTGSPGRRTPAGDFHVTRRVNGWRHSHLGYMYKPLYFHSGYAMHGSLSVPRHPASHGCVRIPMHTADLLPRLVRNGAPVHVRG
ncbi:L,D-transpeptidase family protein [Actinomadura sp. PM05-2]|uniref:L,D-transpeptidase family protein n=2 Tax=Actinomadura parmotrematis TaxID=2864039 RepID=A0ABS7G0T4_9ACTN|nr:L,D-transpeptidase family protein [Actinomadura parmotrematis]